MMSGSATALTPLAAASLAAIGGADRPSRCARHQRAAWCIAPGSPLDRIQRQNADLAAHNGSIRPTLDRGAPAQQGVDADGLIGRLMGLSQGTKAVIMFANLGTPNMLAVQLTFGAICVMNGFLASRIFNAVKQAGREIAGYVRGTAQPPVPEPNNDNPWSRLRPNARMHRQQSK